MSNRLTSHLQILATAYGEKTGLKMTTLGKTIRKDARFFQRLDDGKGFTVQTYDRVVVWFSTHWPGDLDWPDGIERPAPDGSLDVNSASATRAAEAA
ncbi:hypothetical protein [Methylovirgula sp. 4M-Z18]|uniref:hypothetical protein n=1 Tax=Methylovirgula sp. 4M-Z18 TaxID=2293567 RepID=UPI000E2FD600|nr:hypothetical protein [Methylovirgula sp. 4M-Z18]RFB80428.1 hypothetical protein DYH55_02550 [Methylovirgula sp. 4M-Z18]